MPGGIATDCDVGQRRRAALENIRQAAAILRREVATNNRIGQYQRAIIHDTPARLIVANMNVRERRDTIRADISAFDTIPQGCAGETHNSKGAKHDARVPWLRLRARGVDDRRSRAYADKIQIFVQYGENLVVGAGGDVNRIARRSLVDRAVDRLARRRRRETVVGILAGWRDIPGAAGVGGAPAQP